MKVKYTGNNINGVTHNVGGNLSVTPDSKSEPEIKVPKEVAKVAENTDIVSQLNKVGPDKNKNKIAVNALKALAEDNKMQKATGDIKKEDEDKEKKGLAKASPNFKAIPPRADASEIDTKKVIEENTIADDSN